MTISVIIPFYNERLQIPLTLDSVSAVLEETGETFEILAIDDGSEDKSVEVMIEEAKSRPYLRVLSLSRNFGKEAALCAGLDEAKGEAVIVMDGDLQHPPSYIPEMIRLWREGYKVVEGVKSFRGKESRFSKGKANFFYKLFARFSGYNLTNASDFKLLDRQVVDEWTKLRERDTFFRALSAWLGFKRTTFPFEVAERTTGDSKWGGLKLIKLSINAITSFSARPIYAIAMVGMILLLLFFILGIQTLVTYFLGRSIVGFTTVILLQLLIGGGTLFSLGLIGIYIGRIFDEVKDRPRYIISYDSQAESKDTGG